MRSGSGTWYRDLNHTGSGPNHRQALAWDTFTGMDPFGPGAYLCGGMLPRRAGGCMTGIADAAAGGGPDQEATPGPSVVAWSGPGGGGRRIDARPVPQRVTTEAIPGPAQVG